MTWDKRVIESYLNISFQKKKNVTSMWKLHEHRKSADDKSKKTVELYKIVLEKPDFRVFLTWIPRKPVVSLCSRRCWNSSWKFQCQERFAKTFHLVFLKVKAGFFTKIWWYGGSADLPSRRQLARMWVKLIIIDLWRLQNVESCQGWLNKL